MNGTAHLQRNAAPWPTKIVVRGPNVLIYHWQTVLRAMQAGVIRQRVGRPGRSGNDPGSGVRRNGVVATQRVTPGRSATNQT